MPTAASSSSLLLLALACLALPVVVLSSCEYEEALLVDAHRAKSELWRGKTRGGDDADDAVDADAASGLGSCAGMRWDLKKLSLRVRKYESLLSLFVICKKSVGRRGGGGCEDFALVWCGGTWYQARAG